MRTLIVCSLAVVAALSWMDRADAWGRRDCYWGPPQVIYVVPAPGGYYYPVPQRSSAPLAQPAPQSAAQEEGAFYYNPSGAVGRTAPAAPIAPSYPSPVESFESSQPAGWWFR